ncbi:MAG: hypothetical protein QXR42_05670 [Candidatus Bathyarchaeia archaeon]
MRNLINRLDHQRFLMRETHSSSRCHYHLRFQLVPGIDLDERIRDLVDFCLAHSVEEVVLFVAAEEWNNGPLSDADMKLWFETIKYAKKKLEEAGLSVSLNPWATVLHCDRGRRFPKDRKFAPMVSPSGIEAKATASFACPEWKKYICEYYGKFAALGFRVLWIEDDFRYHNHAPLDWGGDFSTLMIERFEKRIGLKTDRQTIVKNILRPGKPHPWRREWLMTWREAQLEAARSIKDAVAAAMPGESILGLMSSRPEKHSIEGRDWAQLFDAISISGKAAHRPHFAGYLEGNGRDLAESSALLDMQKSVRPPNVIVEPEIENSPFTSFSKSNSYTWIHMAIAQLHGCDALLLDLFPFSGVTPSEYPEIGALLDSSRQSLDWLAEHFPPSLQTQGVGIPWHPDSAMHVHTEKGVSMDELNVNMVSAARLLNHFGVAVQMRPSKVNALFGNGTWAWTDEELESFLKGGLWLDAEAAFIMQERGFSQWIGMEIEGWWDREEFNYSMEMAVNPACGLPKDFCMNSNRVKRVARIQPTPQAAEWTSLITSEGKRCGAALTVFQNDLGGRVAVSAFPLGSEEHAWIKSFHRQKLVQKLVSFLAGSEVESVTVTGGAYLMPIDFVGAGRRIAILNGSADSALPVVRVPGAERLKEAYLLRPLTKPKPVIAKKINWHNGITVKIEDAVPYLGMAVLILE